MSILTEEKINEIFDLDPNMGPGDWKGYKRTALVVATRAIEAAVLEAQEKQEPVAWVDAGDLREVGNGNSRYCHPDDQGRMVPLYAEPVVQPDMVMVPREPTKAMLSAPEVKDSDGCWISEYKHAEIYRAMIAAAEGKE